ncbi:MAG TPA: type IV pilus secretin PilQ [Acidobacteriaceae bacterium]|nr:type IV pilus secretin PilQ [Acidobacteriaceae bacterium]
MRIMRRAWGLTALVAAALILTNGALSASDAPVVHVKAVVKDGAVTLDAQANGPFEYTTYRPSESLYVLDLTGVSAGDSAGARIVPSELVKSYRVTTYTAGQKPVVRLEILVRPGVQPRLERNGNQELSLFVSANGNAADVSAPPVAGASVRTPGAASVKPISTKASETKAPASNVEAIEQVSLAQNGEQTEVNVVGSSKLTYHVLRLHNPDRIVLDFAGAHLKTSAKNIASNLDPVKEIRLAQFTPEVSRVVIDLRQPARFDINASGNAITIAFSVDASKGTPGGAVKSTPAAAPQPVDITTTKVSAPDIAPNKVPTPPAVLPTALTQTSAALAAPAPVETPHAPELPAAKPIVAAAPSNGANAGYTENSQPTINTPSAASGAQQAPTPAPAGKYSGEPISVNLKDVDLRDFFRLIHEISGLNVVVDPAVKGTLTIVLDDVPWDQALDIVLKNNDLDKQLDGNVLRIATKETLKKEADQNRELARAQAEAADVVTTTRVLSYAKATDLVPTMKKFLSSRGDILADSRSNTLIIRDIPGVLPVLDNLLRQLDRKSQQVEIEARVVAANRSFSREIGTELAAALGSGNSTLGGATAVGTSPVLHTPAPPFCVGSNCQPTSATQTTPTSGSMPLLTSLGAATPTSGFSYIFQNGKFALDEIITAAEERGVGKLISKPKVITQNNQKAIVKQGTKIPVQTVVNNTVSVQFVDAVLELDVTPQITAEGTIYMDVDVKNDQIDSAIPRVQGIPAIDTQESNTKVLIADGGTVVIGGVIVTQQRTDIQQVPLLGSLPVVGNLFRHTTVSSTAQELLFFLTPRILPG